MSRRARDPSRAEPILLLAHEDRETLLAADVQIDYRRAAPNYDPRASATVFKQIAIDKGTIEDGFAAADRIVEGEYRMGHQEQLYIEPNGVIAVPEAGRRNHGVRVDAVSVLRASGADGAARPARPTRSAWCRPRPAAVSAARKNTRR